jgi:nucleoside-diphosphate-sugar epimerase
MRILLTGSQGKVGSTTARHFAAAGHDVIGVDLARGVYDAPTAADPFPSTYIQADLEDAGAVFALVARFKPDAIVHVAAIPDPCHVCLARPPQKKPARP